MRVFTRTTAGVPTTVRELQRISMVARYYTPLRGPYPHPHMAPIAMRFSPALQRGFPQLVGGKFSPTLQRGFPQLCGKASGPLNVRETPMVLRGSSALLRDLMHNFG